MLPSTAPLLFDDDTVPAEPPPGRLLKPADATLSKVDESEIGAGGGLDEAEEARKK